MSVKFHHLKYLLKEYTKKKTGNNYLALLILQPQSLWNAKDKN